MMNLAIPWGARKASAGAANEAEEREAHAITSLVVLVLNDEDHIETRQDSRLEVDVLLSCHQLHPSPQPKSKKERTSPGLFMSSYLPNTGFAAASTLVLELRMVVMPALAIEIVCCSIAS